MSSFRALVIPAHPGPSELWADARMEIIDVLGSFHDHVDLGALNIYMPYMPISDLPISSSRTALGLPIVLPPPTFKEQSHLFQRRRRRGFRPLRAPRQIDSLSRSKRASVPPPSISKDRTSGHKAGQYFSHQRTSNSSILALRTNPHRPPPLQLYSQKKMAISISESPRGTYLFSMPPLTPY